MLPLVVETWIWYSVVLLVALCRFISRALTLGSVKRLQLDDWIMVFALCTYTAVIVTLNIVANAETNLFPPGFDIAALTPEDIKNRMYGSKIVLVVEENQCMTVWACKACILTMYSRLTVARWENYAIKALMVYVGIGFVIMEILYLGVWCRPFHEYWAVPTHSVQCNAAIHHLITNAVLNLSSDTILLAIALPMFIRSKMPPKKKIAVVGVFSLGIFVILAAVLNKYYSFTSPFGSQWTYWYARESSCTVLVANVPFLWTLVRRIFKVGSLEGTTRNGSTAVRLGQRGGRVDINVGLDPEKGSQSSDPASYRKESQGSSILSKFPKRTEADMCFLTTPAWMEESPASPKRSTAGTPIVERQPSRSSRSSSEPPEIASLSFYEMLRNGPQNPKAIERPEVARAATHTKFGL